MTNSKLLCELIDLSKYSISDIASILCISESKLNAKINNIQEFTSSEILSISRVLNIYNVSKIFFTPCVDNYATSQLFKCDGE